MYRVKCVLTAEKEVVTYEELHGRLICCKYLYLVQISFAYSVLVFIISFYYFFAITFVMTSISYR